jgi:6-phospho-beta-glucosidase
LNHLSWARKVFLDGQDRLAQALADPAFLASTTQAFFDAELVQRLGMFLNEYLFYYYYPDKAVASILKDSMTRGEEILHLNRQFASNMDAIDLTHEPEKALALYFNYTHRRSATYMHYAQPGAPSLEDADRQIDDWLKTPASDEGEGYAGVALDIIEALTGETPLTTGLNIPNEGSIAAMRPADVVEVSARVDRTGIHPLPIGDIPEHQELLMRSVKTYERLAVESILTRSRGLARAALMAHPLVQSYALAGSLVDEYLQAHASFTGDWR